MNVRRSFAIVLLLCGVFGISCGSTLAETTSETSVTVEIADAGALDVHWSGDPVVFLVDGNAPAPVAGKQAIATATLVLAIDDTRADAGRSGYTVAIAMEHLTGESGALPASALSVLAVDGLPEAAIAGSVIGTTLDQPRTLLSVADDAAAISVTITITVQLVIPAGTRPGDYTGAVTLSVGPLLDPEG